MHTRLAVNGDLPFWAVCIGVTLRVEDPSTIDEHRVQRMLRQSVPAHVTAKLEIVKA